MGTYIARYIKLVNKMLEDENTDFAKLKEDFCAKIQFFQHERFVHLIVTFMVVMCLCFSLLCIFVTNGLLSVSILAGILLLLVTGYLIYYYYIENTVMNMYKTYDKIVEKLENSRSKTEASK